MFSFLNGPLGWIIKICYELTNNYAAALLIFSLALQLILLPFGIKQQKNSIKQAKLDPKIRAIKKKYAGRNDQVTQKKMQEETMEVYQKEGYNPMGGCLPLLIQLPILFALYAVVTQPLTYICDYNSSDIYNFAVEAYEQKYDVDLSAEGALAELTDEQKQTLASYGIYNGKDGSLVNVTDFRPGQSEIDIISGMKEVFAMPKYENDSPFSVAKIDGETKVMKEDIPNFNLIGNFMDLSQTPSFNNFNVVLLIPLFTLIVTFGSTIITKKFTYNPSAEAVNTPSMKIMQYSMPLLSLYISFQVSAAVGLYWIFRNLLSVTERIVLSKAMPIPVFTEEDYKQAEKELNVKPEKKKNKEKVRSLHRIDEDDDEETPAVTAPKVPEKKPVSADAPKLKDESDRHKKEDNTEEKEETKD